MKCLFVLCSILLASSATQIVNANGNQCGSRMVVNGITLSSGASAREYSLNSGVGISVTEGTDVGKVPELIVRAFSAKGFSAQCFVHDKKFISGGTEFQFYVAGNLIRYDSRYAFGILELVNNKEILRIVEAEANISGQLLK